MTEFFGEESQSLFDRLAPFRILWDPSGQVRHVSPKARSFLQWDHEIDDNTVVHLVHPYDVILTPPILKELTHMSLHVTLVEGSNRYLRGEVIRLGTSEDGWLFTGIPPIAGTETMAEMGVNLRDLPLHTGITDFILAHEAANVALSEAKRTNSELEKTSQQLRNRTEKLEEKSTDLVEEIRKHQVVSTRLEEALQELQITQDALVQQERYKALGEMISGIAHDFNNILTPILSYSAILKEEPDIPAEERDQFLNWIMTAAMDASELIKRLRRLYKPNMDSGEFRYFEVGRVMDDALALALPRWSSKFRGLEQKIRVERAYDEGLTVFGAESGIRQAVLNLLVNAGDAMQHGGTLTLTTQSTEQEVCISVADTGIGMDEETLQRCQAVFFSTKGERGSGLGLPMVSNTAVRHGGRMDATSALGEGSTFQLYLSRDPSAVELDKTYPSSPVSEGSTAVQIGEEGSDSPALKPSLLPAMIDSLIHSIEEKLEGPIALLLVDDDPAASSATGHLGEKLGIQCHSVESAADALQILEEKTFHMSIADVDMPGMRGDDLAVQVRAMYPDLTVLLYTGRPESVSEAGQQAAEQVLSKPMDARDVLGMALVRLAVRLDLPIPTDESL